MTSYEAVFKVGYTVEASTEAVAREKAKGELLRELLETGVSRFILDINTVEVA